MASPASPPPANTTTICASCGTPATGKFCSNCGSPLAGATCAACGSSLTPGAKFCHRCGAPANAQSGVPTDNKTSFSTALPWGLAAVALVALVALLAGQRFGRSPDDASVSPPADAAGAAPFAGATGNGQAPDISNLSPAEAAVRLYNRVMGAHERGRADSVQIFAPMAITAYQMLGNLDLDQRYDVGRIAAVSGDETVARAEADTILTQNPNHLLGLILAANAAHLRKDAVAERTYRNRFVAAVPAERAKQLPEYITHENDIAVALEAQRP
jgi:hypothetical protein